jgi:hypothetical protein
MLHDFLGAHDIDILYLQTVTQPDLGDLVGYTAYTNVGTYMRGTAFMVGTGTQLDNTKLTSGR